MLRKTRRKGPASRQSPSVRMTCCWPPVRADDRSAILPKFQRDKKKSGTKPEGDDGKGEAEWRFAFFVRMLFQNFVSRISRICRICRIKTGRVFCERWVDSRLLQSLSRITFFTLLLEFQKIQMNTPLPLAEWNLLKIIMRLWKRRMFFTNDPPRDLRATNQ